MQTFLPYENFSQSAKVLDRMRLGKQRVETLQILNILSGIKENSRWKNHPAVKMWKNCGYLLAEYGLEICKEWISRGYKDTCFEKILIIQKEHKIQLGNNRPNWFGHKEFHASHRSNLLRKNPIYYLQFNWVENSNLPYYWPK